MRHSVRALIQQGGTVLFIRRTKGTDMYYVLPGGGVEDSDPNPQAALERELLEELNVKGSVGQLRFEFIDTFKKTETKHSIYECDIPDGNVSLGDGPERLARSEQNTFELVWIDVAEIGGLDIRPEQLKQWMEKEV